MKRKRISCWCVVRVRAFVATWSSLSVDNADQWHCQRYHQLSHRRPVLYFTSAAAAAETGYLQPDIVKLSSSQRHWSWLRSHFRSWQLHGVCSPTTDSGRDVLRTEFDAVRSARDAIRWSLCLIDSHRSKTGQLAREFIAHFSVSSEACCAEKNELPRSQPAEKFHCRGRGKILSIIL